MKKILFSSALFLAISSGFAQKKQLFFDNLLQYSFKSNTEDSSNFKIKYYLDRNQKSSFFELNAFGSTSEMSILQDGKYITINSIGFNQVLNTPENGAYYFDKMNQLGGFFNMQINLSPTGKKGEFMGISCDYYSINLQTDEANYLIADNTCFCIDTKNKVKNVKALFPNANLDGLILAYGHVDYPGEELSLDLIEKTNIVVDFDFNSEYQRLSDDYKKYQEELEAEDIDGDPYVITDSVSYSNYYEDPLCNTYSYISELEGITSALASQFVNLGCELSYLDSDYDSTPDLTRDQAISIAKKQNQAFIKSASKAKIINKKEAEKLTAVVDKLYKDAANFNPKTESSDYIYDGTVVEEAVVDGYWDESDYGYRNYESYYKNQDVQNVSLAAESQFDGNIKNYMPNYCQDLKQNVPNFKNETLKNHVYNLVGQICDLYLYQNGGSVDYFGTIDSMRKSLLEIDNMRENLSKADTKLLNEYLNSLD